MTDDGRSGELVKTVGSARPDLRRWQVAGGLIFNSSSRLLAVNNRRRDGSTDWSPPGGVVDAGETLTGALTREVEEETGLLVSQWSEVIYRVRVVAPDRGFELLAVVYRAVNQCGSIKLGDPDGIVFEAEFCEPEIAAERMKTGPRWVSEPIQELLSNGLLEHSGGEHSGGEHSGSEQAPIFEYVVEGSKSSDQKVTRIDPVDEA